MQSITIPIDKVQTTVNSEQNFVIVGANGSGKSHLGAWIEKQDIKVMMPKVALFKQ